jgi:hypothetical protein
MVNPGTPLQQLERRALEQFTQEITDLFFLYIENNKDLLQEYQRVIGRYTTLDAANISLGGLLKSGSDLTIYRKISDPKVN